jgi:hypothetical protein
MLATRKMRLRSVATGNRWRGPRAAEISSSLISPLTTATHLLNRDSHTMGNKVVKPGGLKPKDIAKLSGTGCASQPPRATGAVTRSGRSRAIRGVPPSGEELLALVLRIWHTLTMVLGIVRLLHSNRRASLQSARPDGARNGVFGRSL